MSRNDAPETEFHVLIKDTADHIRFLAQAGVAFLGAGRPASNSTGDDTDNVHHSPPNRAQPAREAARQEPADDLNGAQPNAEARFSPAVARRQDPPRHEPNAESRTLARTPAVCNQALFGDLRPQQDALFAAVASSPAVAPDVSLEAVREDLGDCRRCKLAQHRTHIVFGEGSPQARLVFVGEGPGAEEDATGRPFVGRAGQLLDKIIAAMNLTREEVYICNVVKCRPPENRTPERDEVAACVGFLHRQLAVIRPRVIVALGASAAAALLDDPKLSGISKIRGRFHNYRGVPLMPTFHPAYLLRTPEKKREVWEDMKQVTAKLRESEGRL